MRTHKILGLALAGCALGAAALAQPPSMLGSPRWFFQYVPAPPPTDLSTPTGQMYVQMLHAVGRHDVHAAIELRAQGYEHYAAETFSELAGLHPDERFARVEVGTYTLDPAFGELLRTVKGLGYRLVAYEAEGEPPQPNATQADRIVYREETQANNLVERIFRAEPQAKALIHVGFSHAAEVALQGSGQPIEWMAARLKAKTGVDPLTIDQTRCASSSDAIELASVSTTLPPGAHDVSVAHPLTVLFRGRPQWRIDAGAIAVELPETLVSEKARTLIEARYDSEPPDAIPLDRLLLAPGERLPLLLPTGAIRIQQYFEDDSAPRTLVLSVR
jgi:hypothetical protein